MSLLKICGLTRIADLRLALRLGADYVGAIVDIPRSPRSLDWGHAAALLRAAEGRGVAVVEKADVEVAATLAKEAKLAAVQPHEAMNVESMAALREALPEGTEVWPVLGMAQIPNMQGAIVADLIETARYYADCGADKIVLDSSVKGQTGGTGVALDWARAACVVANAPVPVLVAGGITPANAKRALEQSGAAGLDASSGVEARPGVKDPRAVAELCAAAR